MKGGLKRMVTLSATGVLHDAANGDAGRGASTPVSLAMAGDLSGYDVCGHPGCFEKEYARRQQKAEKVEAGSQAEKAEAEEPQDDAQPEKADADSVGESAPPAKPKGGRKVA